MYENDASLMRLLSNSTININLRDYSTSSLLQNDIAKRKTCYKVVLSLNLSYNMRKAINLVKILRTYL